MLRRPFPIAILLAVLLAAGCASDESTKVLNVYSARHYDGDDPVYAAFTEETGIEINLLEDKADVLLERIKSEGESSPADVFVTVDAGRLHQATSQGIFRAVDSEFLLSRIPEHLRHPEGLWFGITKRARVIAYSKERVNPDDIRRYEELADPRWKGRVLVRSSSSVYNQSLVGSLIAAHGLQGAEDWCRGLVANFARKPQGGDRDQVRAIAAGEGDLAIVNSYYYVQMLGGSAKDREAAARVALLFPNQDDRGTHVNISGIGMVRNAPHRENALAFIEFLAGDTAQQMLSAGSGEFPTVPGIALEPALAAIGEFDEDALNASVIGDNNTVAIQAMDRAGWR
jgi:iron(III) transport system substrate-binding protein